MNVCNEVDVCVRDQLYYGFVQIPEYCLRREKRRDEEHVSKYVNMYVCMYICAYDHPEVDRIWDTSGIFFQRSYSIYSRMAVSSRVCVHSSSYLNFLGPLVIQETMRPKL